MALVTYYLAIAGYLRSQTIELDFTPPATETDEAKRAPVSEKELERLHKAERDDRAPDSQGRSSYLGRGDGTVRARRLRNARSYGRTSEGPTQRTSQAFQVHGQWADPHLPGDSRSVNGQTRTYQVIPGFLNGKWVVYSNLVGFGSK